MGQRVGLARTQVLIQNLKRELTMGGTTLQGTRRKVLRSSNFTSNAYTLTAADSGAVVLLDEDAAIAITMPAVTSADVGITYLIMVTVGNNTGQTITTAYDNDYWVGGVGNLTTAAENGSKPFVVAGATNTIIALDGNLADGAGAVGSWVRLTAVLTGNTAAGGGAKLVWLVEGVLGNGDANGDGTEIFG